MCQITKTIFGFAVALLKLNADYGAIVVNLTDVVATFCVVCSFSSCLWTRLLFQRRSPASIIEWLLDQLISITLTMIVIIQFWTPLVATSVRAFVTIGTDLERWKHCLSSPSVHSFASWLRLESEFVVPIGLAILLVYVTLKLTGLWTECWWFVGKLGQCVWTVLTNVLSLVWPSDGEANAVCQDVENGRKTKAGSGGSKKFRLCRSRSSCLNC